MEQQTYRVARADYYMGQVGFFFETIVAPTKLVAAENVVRRHFNGKTNTSMERPESVDVLVIEANNPERHEVDVERLTVSLMWVAECMAVTP